jgi:hypothetical protein
LGSLAVDESIVVSTSVSSSQSYTNSAVSATATGIDPVLGESIQVFSFDQIFRSYFPIQLRE